MKWPKLLVLSVCFVACTGQDRILQQDTDRGITLRQTNIETIGCWGEPGMGGTKPTVRLEFSQPSRSFVISREECPGDIAFDASKQPVRIRCGDTVRPLYRLGTIRGVLGEPGDFRPLHEAADLIVAKRGQPILKELLAEAHERGKMVETLIALGDTDCGDYWQVSFQGLSASDQKRVLDGLKTRPGGSRLRQSRIDPSE